MRESVHVKLMGLLDEAWPIGTDSDEETVVKAMAARQTISNVVRAFERHPDRGQARMIADAVLGAIEEHLS